MGMTITEKILARASNKERVDPGEIIIARVDKVMIHDVSGPPALKILEDLGVEKVFDPSRVWVTEDHFVPPPDTKS
ncbi:MAG TPA: 3-isopropylmalate dehydratase, partial [Nitrososphaeria archaeon]|nr:3-isopropylmalate dehydratase [Nitrososphaeria archaeon]